MDSFSSNDDMDSQPAPQQRHHHRRSHSDFSSSFRLPNFDDLLLFDPSDLELSSFPSPLPPPRGASVDSDHSSAAHFRSLSVDSDFFDGLGLSGDADNEAAGGHRHSNSFDSELSFDGLKKSITPEKLAELSLIDPKKVKRILANRQSAARSKERKVRYASELERKVQTLQTEATTLSAQVTVLQRDTTAIITENKELKIRLQATEQQAKLRDALNEKLKEEVERLKFEINHMPLGNGNPFYRGIPSQYAAPQAAMHNQRGGIPSQNQQLHTLHNQSANGQSHPSFMEFNQRT